VLFELWCPGQATKPRTIAAAAAERIKENRDVWVRVMECLLREPGEPSGMADAGGSLHVVSLPIDSSGRVLERDGV
jgi:hypothetical protein